MNVEFGIVNDNILIREKYVDIKINDIPQMIDEDAPFMFCEVLEASYDSKEALDISKGDIVIIKRYGKEEFLSGLFFISHKDVRCIIKPDEFNKLINEGLILER